MDSKLAKKIIEQAKKHVSKPQYIMDLYDFSIVWSDAMLPKLLGYTQKEFLGIHTHELLDDKYTKEEKRDLTFISMTKTKGILPANAMTKNGKIIKLIFSYIRIEVAGGFYEVGSVSKE